MGRVQDKVAIVTGGASGVGREDALLLAREGARVVITDVNVDAGQALAREIGDQALFVQHDIASEADWEAVIQTTTDRFGGVDILVNNAAILAQATIEETSLELWEKIQKINSTGYFLGCKLGLLAMKNRPSGSIVNMSSILGSVGFANSAPYVAAKHGVAGLTKAVALENATHGITVNCISPGYVWTPLVESQIPDTMKARGMTREQAMNDVLLAAQPTKEFVTPEQVAAFALFLCREEAKAITGANLSADGGWTAA